MFLYFKAIFKKLKPRYDDIKNNVEVKNFVNKILALAFLAPEFIINLYRELKGGASDAIKFLLRSFFPYYERYWLRTVTPGGFSVYGLSRRTNNISESFNSELVYLFGSRPYAADFMRTFYVF